MYFCTQFAQIAKFQYFTKMQKQIGKFPCAITSAGISIAGLISLAKLAICGVACGAICGMCEGIWGAACDAICGTYTVRQEIWQDIGYNILYHIHNFRWLCMA